MLELRIHSEVFITAYRKEVSWKETHLIQAKNSTAEFLGKKTRVWRKKIFSQEKKKKVVFFFCRHLGLPECLCQLVSDKEGCMRYYYGLMYSKRQIDF